MKSKAAAIKKRRENIKKQISEIQDEIDKLTSKVKKAKRKRDWIDYFTDGKKLHNKKIQKASLEEEIYGVPNTR